MAVKDRAERWAQGRPARAIVWVAVFGLVVGLLVGVAVGFKVEQHRVHHDVAKLQAQLAGGGTSTKRHGNSKAASGSGTLPAERVGDVTATGTGTVTLATKRHGSLVLHVAGTTKVDRAVGGSAADVSVGRRVLVAKGGRAVIVLPAGRALGRKVTKVSNGVASITKIKGVAQLPLSKIRTVDTSSVATAADIKTGSHVLAWYQPNGKSSANAIEIILLPAGSAFA